LLSRQEGESTDGLARAQRPMESAAAHSARVMSGSRQVGRRPAGPFPGAGRPTVEGKFLGVDGRRLWLRGTTYGTFAEGEEGHEFGPRPQVEADLAAMSAAGINALRTYSVPPPWLLDIAADKGIWLLIGLPWEQHVTFLDERSRAYSIVDRVRAGVAACAGHPAVLGYAVGNEIPASIVRWHGRRRVERFVRELHRAAKAEDPDGLVTYVNFPSTEYLRLPFLDFLAFNVYLEDGSRLDRYLARLQSLAGERPLVMGEIGLDSRRNGVSRQAEVLSWQVRHSFRAGCAGAFVFSWTDEWHRGGHEIHDWDFGLTDRERRPKPALGALKRAFAAVPVNEPVKLPKVSVVVCTHNGAGTLAECLGGLSQLDYPDYEVIVVDDGSTDGSAEIADAHPVRVIRTPNRGLSAARNEGLAAAEGEIVAYIDDDAVPDSHWLRYLAATFVDSDHAGVGGPNVPPPDDGDVAACVANAPGGPVHVLLSDQVAEHIPGCNMAFRRDWLEAIGGFDPQFRVAGDDVDVCWRLQEHGGTLGFHPGALVWHRRRATLRRFWRQQRGYGRAEALLERKWPERYNIAGHLTWAGRLYGRGLMAGLRRSRIYYGVWGTGAFQQRLDRPTGTLWSLAGTPEWYLVLLALAATSAGGLLWRPLLLALPLLAAALGLLLGQAVAGAAHADFRGLAAAHRRRKRRRALTALLYLLQPAARLIGRLQQGLSPWRRPKLRGAGPLWPHTSRLWLEKWAPPEDRLGRIERALRGTGARVQRGGELARWDLEVAAGAFGAVRLRAVLEEHGAGRQQLRARVWPRVPRLVAGAAAGLAGLAALAGIDGAWPAAALLVGGGVLVLACALVECARAAGAVQRSVAPAAATSEELEDASPRRPPVAVEPLHAAALRRPDGKVRTGERRVR
jgi:GT2 family glycosyltransferase